MYGKIFEVLVYFVRKIFYFVVQMGRVVSFGGVSVKFLVFWKYLVLFKMMILYGWFGNVKVLVKVMVDLLYLVQVLLKVIFDILKMFLFEFWEEVRVLRLVDFFICLLLGILFMCFGLLVMMKVFYFVVDKFLVLVFIVDNIVVLGGDWILWL